MSTPLTCPISLAEFAASATHIDKAVTLPPAAYIDTDFYDFERAAGFDRSWLGVGRLDEIPNEGDFFTTTLLGQEKVIVTRGRNKEVHVISAVCQHRGMCVTAPAKRDRRSWYVEPGEQRGNTRTFRCPYHWWTYDLDGRLLGAPDMSHRDDFTRSDIRLPALRTESWNGFIFANFDADAEPLGPSLVKATDLLANYHLEEMVSTPRDVLQDPEGILKELCIKLKIPFYKQMLIWSAGRRESDGIWGKHWYKNVEVSTGFQQYQEKEGNIPNTLKDIYQECCDAYMEINSYKISSKSIVG